MTTQPKFEPLPCSRCCWQSTCGGLSDQQQNLLGCFHRCMTTNQCSPEWVCPCRPDEFIRCFQEVGTFDLRCTVPLIGPSEAFPLYIPKIHHGYSRTTTAKTEMVAISMFDVLGLFKDEYESRFESADALRDSLKVRRDSRVLLVSPDEDSYLETFWRHHRSVIPRLAKLDLAGVTVPNFSFFNDAPRPHTMYNRKRIALVTERLGSAGVPVIPHLNAETSTDWKFWGELLESQSLRYIAKEFRTGKRTPVKGSTAIAELERLQDQLGRPLHPIAIAAAQFVERLAQKFETFTIVDSTPHMKTMMRRRLEVRGDVWIESAAHSAVGEPLDKLLDANLKAYQSSIVRRTLKARSDVPRQLPLFMSSSADEQTATCPACGEQKRVKDDFGTRIVKGRRVRQSWCRACRNTRSGAAPRA